MNAKIELSTEEIDTKDNPLGYKGLYGIDAVFAYHRPHTPIGQILNAIVAVQQRDAGFQCLAEQALETALFELRNQQKI